jgi:hypothetical protein
LALNMNITRDAIAIITFTPKRFSYFYTGNSLNTDCTTHQPL